MLALCAEWTPDSRAKRVCEALIALGADPSVRCVDGSTAEKRAMGVGNMATVALLHAHAQAAAELAQRELMEEEDADGDTLGSLGGSSPPVRPRLRAPAPRPPRRDHLTGAGSARSLAHRADRTCARMARASRSALHVCNFWIHKNILQLTR